MSMKIKPGYVNPLGMNTGAKRLFASAQMRQRQSDKRSTRKSERSDQQGSKDDIKRLQVQRQSLQNQILLLQSTSDSMQNNGEAIEMLHRKLAEVSTQLSSAQVGEPLESAQQAASLKLVQTARQQTSARPAELVQLPESQASVPPAKLRADDAVHKAQGPDRWQIKRRFDRFERESRVAIWTFRQK